MISFRQILILWAVAVALFLAVALVYRIYGFQTIVAIETQSTLRRGMDAEANGRTARAASEYENFLQIDPDEARIRERLIRLYLKVRDPEPALVHAELFSERATESSRALAWALLGEVLLSLNKGTDAERAYTKAVEADAELTDVYWGLARVAEKKKDYGAMKSALKRVQELGSDFASQTYRERFQRAKMSIAESESQDVESYKELLKLGEAYMTVGDISGLLGVYRRAGKIQPLPANLRRRAAGLAATG